MDPMTTDFIEGLSKVFYLGTILLSARLFWLAWNTRKRDKFVPTIFLVYVALVPLYGVFAIMYVWDIAYHSWVGYIGWTTINALFLTTDAMLLEYIVKYGKGETS